MLLQFFRGHITELETGGTGKDPVKNNTNNLPANLQYVPNVAKGAKYGSIQPAYTMTFEEYQNALDGTQLYWSKARHSMCKDWRL